MTSPSSWYAAAHNWRMRAAETLALADEMKEAEPKAIMLRIAADYEKLADWGEENSIPWWDKNRGVSNNDRLFASGSIRRRIEVGSQTESRRDFVCSLGDRGVGMAVYHLFRNAPFTQEQIDLMSAVFEQVSREHGLGEQTDALRDLVANAVLECAQKGIFDPFEMRRCTYEVLSSQDMPRRQGKT